MASDKTTEAISRMRTYLRGNADRHTPQWLADANTLIEAAKGEQRQELVRQFAVALVGTAGWGVNKVWEWAEKLADAEPPSNP
jgi:hypothetical protein